MIKVAETMGGVDRRGVLALGAAALAVRPTAGLAAGMPTAIGQVIDTRFPLTQALAPVAGGWRHPIDGDVTRLWVDRLDAAWRAPGGAVEGMTGEDALFVLEHLAWDRRRRVVRRQPTGQSWQGVRLVRWTIAARGGSAA
jgi:hypothetical protein